MPGAFSMRRWESRRLGSDWSGSIILDQAGSHFQFGAACILIYSRFIPPGTSIPLPRRAFCVKYMGSKESADERDSCLY